MGEAKRREEKGLPPRPKNQKERTDTPNTFAMYQIIPYVLVAFFIGYLIYDLVQYYSAS